MAIFEKTIRNKNFDKLLRKLEQEIPDSSWSADLEAGSDFKEGKASVLRMHFAMQFLWAATATPLPASPAALPKLFTGCRRNCGTRL